MAKERKKWPKGLTRKFGYKKYRQAFLSCLLAELWEAKLIRHCIFSCLALVIGVTLLWAGIDQLRRGDWLPAVFCFVIVLVDAYFMLLKYLPGVDGSLKESFCQADKEGLEAQRKEERKHPDRYR